MEKKTLASRKKLLLSINKQGRRRPACTITQLDRGLPFFAYVISESCKIINLQSEETEKRAHLNAYSAYMAYDSYSSNDQSCHAMFIARRKAIFT